MKQTFDKPTLIFLFAIFLSRSLLAQDELNQPNIRFYLSEDKSSYVGAVFINQIWTRNIWNNPDIDGEDQGSAFDMGIRRSRAIFYTYLFDKVFAYTMFGADGISFMTSGKPVVSLYNAQTEYIFVKDKFHLGFGLSTWNGISRYNNCKLLEFLVVDNPGFAYPVGGKHDRFGRQLGIYAKGTLSKLHYRVALVKPFKYDGTNDPWTYGTKMIPNDNLAVKGYLTWHFFDKEGTLMPYMTMNNLGRAKLFNIGGGFYYHPDAMGNEIYSGNINEHNIFLYAIDAFLDMPLKKGAAITSYLGFNNFDFGPNYIRAQGTMNVSDSDPSMAIAQGVGNSQWEVGTGQILRAELGYLLPGKGIKNRFQPYGACTWKNFDGLNETSVQFDAGINWLMHGHNIKWTLQYSSRPVYGIENGKYNWINSKGEMILQTQIFF